MLPAIIILCSLGLLFGVGLFIASRVFKVYVDPRVVSVEHVLPGANCGACGLAGCSSFAKAIVHGSAEITGCIPGGEAVAHLVADIMGVEAKTVEKDVAVMMCHGRDVQDRFEYDGIKTCAAANLIHGGPKECSVGCIGYGDCAAACSFGAIHMVDGFPVVDESKCTACGKCVAVCPKRLFKTLPVAKLVHVGCVNCESGKLVRRYCKAGCIGCKKCETSCKFDAIHVVKNLAVIDYEKCVSCGICAKECPTGTIFSQREVRKAAGLWPVKKSKEAQVQQ